MSHYLAAVAGGVIVGAAVAFAAFRVSEHFDTQLIPF